MLNRVFRLCPTAAGVRERWKLVMVTVRMSYPSLGTRRVSMPPSAPTKRMRQPGWRS